MPMYSAWLTALSWLMVSAGVLCFVWTALDVRRHPQTMGVMNYVWPLTALYGTLLAVWFYRRYGRNVKAVAGEHSGAQSDMAHRSDHMHMQPTQPFPVIVAKGATHCGAGCTLGDILAELLVLFFPAILTMFGYHTLFSDPIFAKWGLDYLFAFSIGVAFQYFAIAPMQKLPLLKGIWVAAKVDFLSLTSWQIGMYGFMALAHFYIFQSVLGAKLGAATPEFWFMMQIAMMAGFATAYPVNWMLIKKGIKEAM